MLDERSQESGDNGINQQANNGGVAQNAGRDAYIGCSFENPKVEDDFGIIEEIFNYIFQNKVTNPTSVVSQDSEKVIRLKEKLALNFDDSERKEIGELITKNFERIVIVRRYVEEYNVVSSERIDALILQIKSFYRVKKECISSEEKIESLRIIEAISNEFVPAGKAKNPDYYAGALAIVLHFFEMCEIGKKTSTEPQLNLNLFA